VEGFHVQTVAYIDIKKYRCILENISTDEVIITDERIQHIIDRRGKSFLDKYGPYFPQVLFEPDYIFLDNRPHTVLVCKSFEENGSSLNLVVRLAVIEDNSLFKNSIITAMKENRKRFAQRLRNHVPLYKRG